MKNLARTIHAKHQTDDGSVTDVLVTISKPKQEKGQQDWSCIVHCPLLFSPDKKIVGADADQALALAEIFIRDLLEHHGVQL